MATKPLTTAAIAMTEKKMDMSLDDIIKMSKTGPGTNKTKKQRIPSKNHKFTNNDVQDKSLKLRRFMDTRSSIRQGVLAQRRSSFQGNQFPFASDAARKAAVAPIRNRNFMRNQPMTSYRPSRAAVGRPLPAQHRGGTITNGGGFAVKQQVRVVSKQRPQTLDSLFANMKEQRMMKKKNVFSQNNTNTNTNNGRRNGPAQQRSTPPWTRYNY